MFNAAPDSRRQVGGIGHRAFGSDDHALRQLGVVYVRVFDACAQPRVVDAALSPDRSPLNCPGSYQKFLAVMSACTEVNIARRKGL